MAKRFVAPCRKARNSNSLHGLLVAATFAHAPCSVCVWTHVSSGAQLAHSTASGGVLDVGAGRCVCGWCRCVAMDRGFDASYVTAFVVAHHDLGQLMDLVESTVRAGVTHVVRCGGVRAECDTDWSAWACSLSACLMICRSCAWPTANRLCSCHIPSRG